MSSVVQLHELPESREVTMDPPTLTRHWVCEGLHGDYEVGKKVRADTPRTLLHPMDTTVWRHDAQIKEIGYKVYHIKLLYARNNREIGSYRIQFSTLGGTVHVKGGIHVAVFPSGMPTHDGLIGVKGDDVEGVDIPIPALKITVHFTHKAKDLTDERVRVLSRLTGAVDTAGFMGWDPYETLFLGAEGSQTTDVSTEGEESTTEIAYQFAMSENLAGFQVAGITGIAKKGWDVLWTKWREQVEAEKASNEAEYCNVVRVHKERDLKTILGFG